MYESPSIHLDIARQRHQQVLADAEQRRLVAQAVPKDGGGESLAAVRGVFAGILAAVSGFGQRARPAPQKPGLHTA